MGLLDTIKSWFKPATPSTSPEVAEEVVVSEESCGEVFAQILRDAGVRDREMRKVNAVEKFEEWYDGECNEESIRASLDTFKEQHPPIAAKMAGKI